MAACERCGARKLKKRQRGQFAGFYCCPKCGPVGPKPKIEAAIMGVPVEVRNAIHAKQLEIPTEEGRRAVQVEMVNAYKQERTDEQRRCLDVPSAEDGARFHDLPDMV